MATSGIDRTLKIWDLRTYKLMHSYRVASGANTLAFSQKGLLAAGMGNTVEVSYVIYLISLSHVNIVIVLFNNYLS